MRSLATGLLLIPLLAMSACAYRMVVPVAPTGGIRLDIDATTGRFAAMQAELHRSLSRAIAADLGWAVRPNGSARLEILMDEEVIADAARDARGIAASWRITVRCRVILHGHGPPHESRQQASATYTALDNEPRAIEAASRSLAANITNWLMSISTAGR